MSYIMSPYDKALQYILDNGVRKTNRTGMDELSVFGIESRYDISEYFPILTGRKLNYKAGFAELLWVLSGSTNNKDLQKLGTNIWTPWISKEFEKEKGYVEGSLGKIYGFQLRHYDGEYKDGSGDEYGLGGFDQLEYLINLIKNEPDSRRKLFSLWNPTDLSDQRLACCHVLFQVYIYENKMSGCLFQRSADYPVGVPFNTIFYSALIYMLAQQTGYKPYEFVHYTTESHIYFNQIDSVKKYLNNPKPSSPKLIINKKSSMDKYAVEDFIVKDYNPMDSIKIPVIV